MQTGDVIRDAHGRSYQIGPMLGRGLVGKTYLVRQEDNGAEFTMKCPLAREDFREDTPAGQDLIEACRDTMLETGRLLEDGLHAFLPPLHTRFTTADGTPVLVLPRYTTNLEERLSQGCSFAEVLETLIQVARHLMNLAGDWGPHGNLRPGNILLNDRGDVFLTDPATDAHRRSRARLSAISRDGNSYLPPEATRGSGIDPRASGIDTYAIGMILYRAICTPRDGNPDGRTQPSLPQEGLDKRDLLEIKTRTEERLREEDSNPRFHSRLADRAAAFLNRAISRETHPSPPFRFRQMNEVLKRLEQILALIRPEVAHVGKLILTRPPNSDVFEAGEDVVFTVGVTPSAGIDDHDEISCGLAIFNTETEERLRDVPCSYTIDRQPTGRFRFSFKVHDLTPARYVIRAAFAIRESGHPPATAEADLEVRAGPGYVPPPAARDDLSTGGGVIPLSRVDDTPDTAVTEVGKPGRLPTSAEPVARTPLTVVPPVSPRPEPLDEVATPISRGSPLPAPPLQLPKPPRTPSPAVTSNRPVPSPVPIAIQPPPKISQPEPEPLQEPVVDSGAWMDLPPPGMVDAEELPDFMAPRSGDDAEVADLDDGDTTNPLTRFVDMIRGDSYLALMTGFGLVILVLLILLQFLKD